MICRGLFRKMSRVLIFVIVGALLGPASAQSKSEVRLAGSVQTVRIEVAEFTTNDGKSVEGPRMPVQTVDYDQRGNRTKRVDYNRDGSIAQTMVYSYDPEGRSTGYEDFTPGLNAPRKHIYLLASDGKRSEYKIIQPTGSTADEKYLYKYDANGNKTAEELYHKTSLISRNENSYDAQGRLISQVIYNPDNSVNARIQNTFAADGKPLERVRHDGDLLTYRVQYKYDDKGRLIERDVAGSFVDLDSDAEGYAAGKVVYSYKGKAQPKEAVTYNPDGSFRDKVEFDYDSQGNWKKRTRKVRVAGKEVKQQVEYRTITYY